MQDAQQTAHLILAARNATQTAHLIAATIGFISYGLLWLDVIWGIVLRLGWAFTRVRHSTLHGTHYSLALTGLVLGVVHAAGQLAVPDGPVGLVNEFVPFTPMNHPTSYDVGTGLGVIATEIMIAMAVSVAIQKKLGFNRWRRLHMFAYPAFILLALHLIITGSEMKGVAARVAIAASVAVTVLLRMATSPMAASLSQRANERFSKPVQANQVTVSVDPIKCARFGFCEHEAPDVFKLGGDGRLTYKRQVPARRADAVISAAAVCPARAIMVDRMATTVIMPGTSQGQPVSGQPVAAPAQPAQVSRAAGRQTSSGTSTGLSRETWSGAGRQTWGGTGRHSREA